jgi:hypothetical protein
VILNVVARMTGAYYRVKHPRVNGITDAGIKMGSYIPTFSLIHDSKKV